MSIIVVSWWDGTAHWLCYHWTFQTKTTPTNWIWPAVGWELPPTCGLTFFSITTSSSWCASKDGWNVFVFLTASMFTFFKLTDGKTLSSLLGIHFFFFTASRSTFFSPTKGNAGCSSSGGVHFFFSTAATSTFFRPTAGRFLASSGGGSHFFFSTDSMSTFLGQQLG